jgi:hypothetical protein
VERPVTMRICGPADERVLDGLARLDSARPLEGTILAAEVDDEPLAAICLETRRVVADPFSQTAALVDLLRARAAHLQTAKDAHLTRRSRSLRRARAWLRRPVPEANS